MHWLIFISATTYGISQSIPPQPQTDDGPTLTGNKYIPFFSKEKAGIIRKFYERKIVIIFLPTNLNICFGCSKELSHCDGTFEYPQHMFWMRNKENSYPIHTLIWRPDEMTLLKEDLLFSYTCKNIICCRLAHI